MKKLCVVSNVIGNRDVIHNGDNGYVCESVDDFVKAISERNIRYIEKAYQDLLENYETKIQAEGYKEIYRKAMK